MQYYFDNSVLSIALSAVFALQALQFVFSGLSVKQAIPGNSLPSSNSSEAPPPVEICVKLSSKCNFLIAATESPPPTIDIAFVAAIASATFSVPMLNFKKRRKQTLWKF